MTTYSIPHNKIENQLIGNILEENSQEFFNLRMEMGKSISAPPPRFIEVMKSSSPDFYPNNKPEDYSPTHPMQQPNNPHMPPNQALQNQKWAQAYYEANNFDAFQTIQQQPPEVTEPHIRKMSSNDYSPVIQQRPHSQSLHYHDHQTYGYPGAFNSFVEARNKVTQGMNMGPNQGLPQNPQGRLQTGVEGSIAYNNQFYPSQPNHSLPIQLPQEKLQGQTFFPQHHSGNTNNINQFQTIMRKSSADPTFYSQKSPVRTQMPVQQFPRNSENNQAYFGMNMYTNQNQNQNFMDNQGNRKQSFKGAPPKRMNSTSSMGSNMTSESQSFYPMGFQEMPSPYPDNNFMNGTYQGMYPGSPTKAATSLNMKYILANLLDACKDQNGSRIIQQYFEKADRDEKERLFQQILANGPMLIADMFGNYVIQKILELGTIQQKLKIFELLKGKIFMLSQHTYSCRVIQKALEEFKNNGPVQDEILKELSVDIVCLVEDQNGNHVIQKCVETLPSEKLRFVIDKVTERIERLPFHAFGCRVIQRILEYSTFEQTAPMLKKIMAKCLECCESQYGNYIMQHILEKGPHTEKDALLAVLRDNFVRLSLNKFASNVAEKSAIHANAEFRQDVVEILVTTNYENKLSLVALMNHPFGNYVVQRLFECSDKNLRRRIYDALVKPENLEEIKKTNYGKHVSAFIEKLMDIQKD